MRDYQNYLFDLYGTLVDIKTDERDPEVYHKLRRYFWFNGASYEEKELYDAFFEEISKEEERRKEEGREVEIDIRNVFYELYARKDVYPSERTVEKTALRFRKYSRKELRLYTGAIKLLRTLKRKGKTILLVSNAQAVFTNEELKKLHLDTVFHGYYLSSDFGYKKPDELFYKKILKDNDLIPSDCLMIGNDRYSDVYGAKRLGMDTYYIRSGLSPKKDYPVKATYEQRGMNLNTLLKKLLDTRPVR